MKPSSLKLILNSICLVVCICLLSQCKKDKLTVESESPSESKDSSIQALFARYGAQSQYFSIDPTQAQLITGQNGIQIYIPQNSFVDANNQVITTAIQLELKEILKTKDMVLSNMPTVSNGNLLESGGEFYINATSNGQNLFLGNNKLTVSIPANGLNYNMSKFVGVVDPSINWQLSPGDTTVSPIQDSSGTKYVMYLDSIDFNYNWINCDAYSNDPNPKTNVLADVSPDTVYSDTNTVVYMVVPSTNSVYNMASPDPFTALNIPEGKLVTFVGFSYHNNKLYFGYKENVTVTSGIMESLPLTEMSEQDMITLLDQIL